MAPGVPIGPVTPKRVELAWASGFYDGEGSTFVRRRDQYVVIGISQSDARGMPAVLVRFRDAVGGIGGISGPIHVRTPSGGEAEIKWIYNAFGHEMVQAVIAQIWPWLGSIKREQARRALLAHRAYREGKRRVRSATFGRPFQDACKRGHDLQLASVRPGRPRQCPQCAHERYVARRLRTRP